MSPEQYVATHKIGLVMNVAPGKRGDLYIFQCGPYLKIGISANGWRQRIDKMRTHNPFRIRKVLVRSTPLRTLRYAEGYVHQELSAYHHAGEWFLVNKEVAAAAVKRGARVAELAAQRLLETNFAWQQNRSNWQIFGTPVFERDASA